MKNKLNLIVLLSFLCISTIFSQAPNLGTSANYAVFTSVGAFTNDGLTVITGNIGTNLGAFTGFPPGTVIGEINVQNPSTAQAAADLLLAYSSLASATCTASAANVLGSGQILTPNVYCLTGVSSLNGLLTLDAQGNPDAVFIIKIAGAFSTTTASSVVLINGAKPANVYWQIMGAIGLGTNSTFVGTIVSDAAITFMDGASLQGRALTITGAIAMHNNVVTIPAQVPLPIELVSFSVKVIEKQSIKIDWITSSEKSNKEFAVEKSKDLINFETVGNVNYLILNKGSKINSYSLVDPNPYNCTSYYRLKQTDLNNKITIYKAVQVVLRNDNYTLFPNPVLSGQQFMVTLDEPQMAEIKLVNLAGFIVPIQKYTNQNGWLTISPAVNLQAGIYLLKIVERGQIRNHHLVVN